MNTVPEVQFEPDKEIAREDVLGKLITIVDKTNYLDHLNFVLNVSPKQKMSQGSPKVAAPFHKMCIKFIIYEPKAGSKETKGSWLQYIEVDDFLLLCKEVLANPSIPDPSVNKWGLTLTEFVGYSEKKKEAKTLTIKIMASSKDPNKASYALQFSRGKAETSPESVGFKYVGEQEKASIFLSEAQFKRILSTSQDYLDSLRTAVVTRYYEPLFGNKKND